MEATPHIMSRYDKDLDKLKRRILGMGTQVLDQFNDAAEALDNFHQKQQTTLLPL